MFLAGLNALGLNGPALKALVIVSVGTHALCLHGLGSLVIFGSVELSCRGLSGIGLSGSLLVGTSGSIGIWPRWHLASLAPDGVEKLVPN